MKTQTLNQIKSSSQTDEQYKARYNELKEHFSNKDNRYIQFADYDLFLEYKDKSSGLRWFHQGKYKVEIVINAHCYADNRTHQNIMPFILFSSFEDAILNMVLWENSAMKIIEDQKKINERN